MFGIPSYFAPEGSTCIRARYGDLGDGVISVRNVLNYPDGSWSQICGKATTPDPEEPGSLNVQFPQCKQAHLDF